MVMVVFMMTPGVDVVKEAASDLVRKPEEHRLEISLVSVDFLCTKDGFVDRELLPRP